MFNNADLELLKHKEISLITIDEQLKRFKIGFPFLSIISAASEEKGVLKLAGAEKEEYLKEWVDYVKSGKSITKFVPASGAASRMFKDLYGFLESENDVPTSDFEKTFFDNIHKFAFFEILDVACKDQYDRDIDGLIADGKYKDIVTVLLSSKGLDYGNLPKGLLTFHSYPEGNRTPVGEHLTEGALYAKDKYGNVNIHFTVSPEHMEMFQLLVAARKLGYEQKLGVKYHVSFSVQKPSTDTIAADMDNNPFRDTNGNLVFRPGGHGALIENLNEIDSDIIFIKNIDNVVPDRLKDNESHYKCLLAGVLVSLQKRAYAYLEKLVSEDYTATDLKEILSFTENELCINHSGISFKNDHDLNQYLQSKLDRPFRVCGMVKNIGEPGGGPFITKNEDGTASLQILESSQIDENDAVAVNAFKNGSHFNPVDLVCGVKDYKGEKYNLPDYVDTNTGFISQKSKNGHELKALELPGLWNGAMSDWNTIFVEVPISTFNPVKTVNDLLRPEHQNN
ncbi:MAG: DUF4301 family protein [Dysgonamonadaceae bacterium]|nr:DUF4301 family protein [Dysgonamonadaceae bacterium]